MEGKVLNLLKAYCRSLTDSGMADEEEVKGILIKLSSETNESKRELLNKRQVAELAKVHPRTVDRWAAEGKLTRRIIGTNSCRFDSEEVKRFLFG